MSVALMDELAQSIAVMDRPAAVEAIRQTHCSFDLDFTDEYLDSISLDRLRHILLAAKLHEVDWP